MYQFKDVSQEAPVKLSQMEEDLVSIMILTPGVTRRMAIAQLAQELPYDEPIGPEIEEPAS